MSAATVLRRLGGRGLAAGLWHQARTLRRSYIPSLSVWKANGSYSYELEEFSPAVPLDQLQVVPPKHTPGEDPGLDVKLTETFRLMSPYINVHRGRIMVFHVCGEAIEARNFTNLMQDIALVSTLGVKVVLVLGCRPQINSRLFAKGMKPEYGKLRRITNPETLDVVKDAAGFVRVQVESALTCGVVNAPGAGHRLNVTSGNFIIAQPVGVREGIDYLYTGDVRKINTEKMKALLDAGDVVAVSNIGYSHSGEVFNCHSEQIATRCAIELQAAKLIFLHEGEEVVDVRSDRRVNNMPQSTAREFVERLRDSKEANRLFISYLTEGVTACAKGIQRVHLINRHKDGAILMELFTRDGLGLMISGDIYDGIRTAKDSDIPGIMRLIQAQGLLVTRSQESIETDIHKFSVFERDGAILACAALHIYDGNVAELACVAVDGTYRGSGKGNALLGYMLRKAHALGVEKVFVLTTRTSHWFVERGFQPANLSDLPASKREQVDVRRKSRIYMMDIQSQRAIDERELMMQL